MSRLSFQLDQRVGEKNPARKGKKAAAPKANPLEKMLTRNNDNDNDEMSDYDKIRMRNIQERLDLYKKVRCYERPASLALISTLFRNSSTCRLLSTTLKSYP